VGIPRRDLLIPDWRLSIDRSRVRELLDGTPVERYLVGWIVLAVAFGAEGVSLL